jgi:uncharacterized repeat protein (TIGR01451 family)
VTADLAVVLKAAPGQLTLGQPVTYIAKVTNNGPSPATAVKLTDALPAGAAVVSITPSAGTCIGRATIVCALGTLADQASATVTIIATPGTAGTARNRVSVQAQQIDPDQTTNTGQVQTTVLAPQTSGGGTQGGSQGGSSALVAKVIALHGRRVRGRARVVAVLTVNRPVTLRVTLAFRGRAIAAKTASITGSRRSLILIAKRKTPAGSYAFRAVLTDSNRRAQALSVRLRLK